MIECNDNFTSDRVDTRECVHFCAFQIDYSDFFRYAMHFNLEGRNQCQLVVTYPSLEGIIPHETIDTMLTLGAIVAALLHTFFFANVNSKHYQNYHSVLELNDAYLITANILPHLLCCKCLE